MRGRRRKRRKRKLNVKLLAWMVGGAFLLAASGHSLHALQMRWNAKALLAQATRLEEAGDAANASSSLYAYLKYVPNDAAVEERYGRLLLKISEESNSRSKRPAAARDALLAFDQVLRREPERDDVRRHTIKLALKMRQYKDAERALKELIEAQPPPPDRAELLYQLGQCAENSNKFDGHEGAVDWYRQASTEDPTLIKAYVAAAQVLRDQLQSTQKANEEINKLTTANRNSYIAHLEKYRFLKRKNAEEAATALNAAYELAPNDAEVLFARGQAQEQIGTRDHNAAASKGARTTYERGIEHHPGDLRFYLARASLDYAQGNLQGALSGIHQGLKAKVDANATSAFHRLQLTRMGADVCIELGKLNDAEALIATLNDDTSAEPVRQYQDFLKARILVSNHKWGEASLKLEPLARSFRDQPIMSKRIAVLLGRCFQELQDTERAVICYQDALRLDPGKREAHVGLADIYLAQGNVNEAVVHYRTALRGVAATKRLPLARALLQQNRLLPREQRSWNDFDEILAKADVESPENVNVLVLRAGGLASRGDAKARRVIEQAQKKLPDSLELVTDLADLLLSQNQPEKALEALDRARKRFGDSVELRLAYVHHWRERGGRGGKEAIDESLDAFAALAKDRSEFSESEQIHLEQTLAAAYERFGKFAEATQIRSDRKEGTLPTTREGRARQRTAGDPAKKSAGS
jgi:tetratricopeptide (TPR) repeat protein